MDIDPYRFGPTPSTPQLVESGPPEGLIRLISQRPAPRAHGLFSFTRENAMT